MSTEQEMVKALQDSGHRLTPQRLMILSALRQLKGHLTAAEILQKVKADYPFMDVSTVYRTLAVLRDMRMVSETDMGGGEYRYEVLAKQGHHHLLCRECGHEAELDHEFVARLADDIEGRFGFRAEIEHLAIFGQCSGCGDNGTPDGNI